MRKSILALFIVVILLFISWLLIKSNIYKEHYDYVDYDKVETLPISNVIDLGYANDGGTIFVSTILNDGSNFNFYWDGRVRVVTLKDEIFGFPPRHIFIMGDSTGPTKDEEVPIGGAKEISIIKGLENWLSKNKDKGEISNQVSRLVERLKNKNR